MSAPVMSILAKDMEEIKNIAQAAVKKHYGFTSALRHATENGQLEIIQCLMETYGKTLKQEEAKEIIYALKEAAGRGYLEIFQYLLGVCNQRDAAKVELELADTLQCAAYGGQLNIINYMLKIYDGDKQKQLKVHQVLPAAAIKGHLGVVKYLVQAYGKQQGATAALNIRTTLYQAVKYNKPEVVSWLIKVYQHKPEVMIVLAAESIPECAAISGQLEVIKYFVENFVEKCNEESKAKAMLRVVEALEFAAMYDRLEIVEYLLKTYDPNAEARAELGIAKAFTSSGLEVMQYLLKIYGQNSKTKAILSIAEKFKYAIDQHDKPEIVHYLIKHYSDIDPAINQIIAFEFSMEQLKKNFKLDFGMPMFYVEKQMEGKFDDMNNLIQAIINSKNKALIAIVIQPEILNFLTGVFNEGVEPPYFTQTIKLLNHAKALIPLIDISDQARLLKTSQKSLKRLQEDQRQLADIADDAHTTITRKLE